MRDYKAEHFRFPRTMRDSSVRGELEREDNTAFAAIVGWGMVGAFVLGLFLWVVLGWSA